MSDYVEPDFDQDFDESPLPVTYYTQAKGERTNYPFSCDCSGLVWWTYNQLGLANVMFPSEDAGVQEQLEWFQATHWRAADLRLQWNQKDPSGVFTTRMARLTLNSKVMVDLDGDGEAETEQDFLQPGDLLYRLASPTGEGDHVSFFTGWDGAAIRVYDAHSLSTPAVGYRTIAYDTFVDSYTHVLRPKPVGYLMSYRYGASVPKAV